MLKWYAPSGEEESLTFGHFNYMDAIRSLDGQNGFKTRRLFEGPTKCLRKLHCHVSSMTPGASYEAHVDAYDVAIIVLEGEVETLGERIGAHGVIFYPAGEPHGMRSPGEGEAKYIVFEFHGSQSAQDEVHPPTPRLFMEKLVDPKCWIRKIKHLTTGVFRLLFRPLHK